MTKESHERRKEPATGRRTFGELAEVALKARVRDARGENVRRVVTTNLAWVSWPREDGRHGYASLRRKQGLITGELGVSLVPVELDELPLITTTDGAPPEGCRLPLGMLLHGHSKTWSSGGSEKALIERLDWIAHQLHLRLHAFMAATKPPAA